jgi:hypothetical protein
MASRAGWDDFAGVMFQRYHFLTWGHFLHSFLRSQLEVLHWNGLGTGHGSVWKPFVLGDVNLLPPPAHTFLLLRRPHSFLRPRGEEETVFHDGIIHGATKQTNLGFHLAQDGLQKAWIA